MAEKFPPHGLALYNSRGEYRYCYNDSDVVNAKNEGYTSKKYVKSAWPKTLYNKKTGEPRVVGKLTQSAEENQKAVDALGPDWTTDHVAAPEPVAAKTAEPSSVDNGMLADAIGNIALLKKVTDELEEAAVATDGTVDALGARCASLEGRVAELETTIAEMGKAIAKLQAAAPKEAGKGQKPPVEPVAPKE